MPERPPSPTTDPTRIFSSPIVEDGNVYFGTSTDGQPGERGYIVAASLLTGDPVWIHQTDVNARGTVLDDGCGGVWSSGSYLPGLDDVVFTLADCNDGNVLTTLAERGRLARRPHGGGAVDDERGRTEPDVRLRRGRHQCRARRERQPRTSSVPTARTARYVSLDPATGAIRWSTRAVFGGSAGGFLGSPAFDGGVIYGATGIGDLSHSPGVQSGEPR